MWLQSRPEVTVRYLGLYANAHRGKVRKAQPDRHPFIIIEEESPRTPRRDWAEMIRKVYEVDPLTCPLCEGTLCIVSFIEDHVVIENNTKHPKQTFKVPVFIRHKAASYDRRGNLS